MTLFWIFALFLCGGTATASALSRIAGGAPSSVERHPSIVQVEFMSQDDGAWTQYCGGTILAARFVLSAAQCFSGWGYIAPFRRIRAGATHRHVGGVIVYVAAAVNHPDYLGRGLDTDISVVRLATALPAWPTIQQAPIVTQGSIVPDNAPVVLAGWGRDPQAGPLSTVLREVTVFTINNDVCAELYTDFSAHVVITKNILCTGIRNVSGRHASFDDAGGPVYFSGIVVGVITGGFNTAGGRRPGINTAVASYTNWIVNVTRLPFM